MNQKKLFAPLCHNSSLPPPAVFQCEDWSSQQVSEWLKGVDDGIGPFLRHFIALNIDGNKLTNIDSDSLKRMGINREATRNKISTATNLLIYYSHSIKYENLQKLALKTSLASNELLTAVSQATPVINTSSNVSKHIETLNAVLRALADTYEATVRLIFWLERNPFVTNKKFARLRNHLTALVDEMVDCINNPNNPKFFSVPQVLVERTRSIQRICKDIIFMDDPSVLYTAFLDRITIRRPTNADWGFEVGRTCLGVNLITRVDYNSPAAFSDKLDVGDEILEVDGCPVVGWKHSNVLRRLNSKLLGQQQFPSLSGNVALELLLCKRPRESVGSPQRPPKVQMADGREQQETKYLTKLAMDFKNKIGTDSSRKWHRRQQQPQSKEEESEHAALRRARSSSFTANTNMHSRRCSECSLPQTSRCISLLMPSGKQPLFRRASVWNESPPATLRSPFEGFHSESNAWLLLLASWGTDYRAKVAEKREQHRMQQQKPPPLQGILEAGGISVLIEEGTHETEEEGEEAEARNSSSVADLAGIVFSSIEVVQDSELPKLAVAGTPVGTGASICESEWNAPVREITGLHTQRPPVLLESGNSTAIIVDSPLSNIHAKIARFFYGDVSAQHPQAEQPAGQTTTAKLTSHQRQWPPNAECKTPITPNSKFSLDLPLSAASTAKPGEETSSLCSVDSPSSYSTIVRTIGCRYRLAPLAEPDEVGDLLSAFMPEEERIINQHNMQQPIQPENRGEAMTVQSKLLRLARVPAQSQGPAKMEGWIRRELLPLERRRQVFRASFRRKRWTRCWALIQADGLLYVYPDQMAKEADVVCELPLCTLSTKTELIRTSKKHTFLLSCGLTGARMHFATYSVEDLSKWIAQIQAFTGSEGERGKNSGTGPAIFVRHEFELCAGQQIPVSVSVTDLG